MAVNRALTALRQAALHGENIMPPSIAAAKAGAKAGATTGEWGAAIRSAFGEYRALTGVSPAPCNRKGGGGPNPYRRRRRLNQPQSPPESAIGKPGLDGHSNGAEQITARARGCGMAIHYDGIRHTPAGIVAQVLEQSPHVIGLSVLSGRHMPLVDDTLVALREAHLSHIPLIISGIIPEADAETLRTPGVAATYKPKDFNLNRIMMDIVGLAELRAKAA